MSRTEQRTRGFRHRRPPGAAGPPGRSPRSRSLPLPPPPQHEEPPERPARLPGPGAEAHAPLSAVRPREVPLNRRSGSRCRFGAPAAPPVRRTRRVPRGRTPAAPGSPRYLPGPRLRGAAAAGTGRWRGAAAAPPPCPAPPPAALTAPRRQRRLSALRGRGRREEPYGHWLSAAKRPALLNRIQSEHSTSSLPARATTVANKKTAHL